MKKLIILLFIITNLTLTIFSNALENVKTYSEYSKIASILSKDIENVVDGNIIIRIDKKILPDKYLKDYQNEYSGFNSLNISEKSIPFLKYSPTAFALFAFSTLDLIKNLNSNILYFSMMYPLGIDFFFLSNPISDNVKNKFIDSRLLKSLIEEKLFSKKNINLTNSVSLKSAYIVDIYIHNISQTSTLDNYGIAYNKKRILNYVITMEISNISGKKLFQKSYSDSQIVENEEKLKVWDFLFDLTLFGTGLFLIFNK